MKDHLAFGQLRNYFFRTNNVFEHRLARHNLSNNLLILHIDIFKVSQEIKGLDEFDISTCRRHPVILNHVAAKLLANFREAFEADIDNMRFFREELTQLLGWRIFFYIHDLPGKNFFYRLFEVSSDCPDCRAACQLIIFAYDYPGILQLPNRLIVPL